MAMKWYSRTTRQLVISHRDICLDTLTFNVYDLLFASPYLDESGVLLLPAADGVLLLWTGILIRIRKYFQ